MKKGMLILVALMFVFSATAANKVCSRACWVGVGKIIGAAYAWYQPSDIPCGTISWPGAKVYFVEGYLDRGKLVILDSGWTNNAGMQC